MTTQPRQPMFRRVPVSYQDYTEAKNYLLSGYSKDMQRQLREFVEWSAEMLAKCNTSGCLYFLGTEALPPSIGYALTAVEVNRLLSKLGIKVDSPH